MPKIIDKQAKKVAILEAAICVFAEKGALNTKVADIAQAAGIGKGTVYEYYSGKEAIFQDAMDRYFGNMLESIIPTLPEISDPRDQLRRLATAVMHDFSEHIEILQVILDFWAVGIRSGQMGLWRETYHSLIQVVSDIVERGIAEGLFRQIDSWAISSAFLGMLDGIMFQLVLFKTEYPLQTVLDTVLDHFIMGLVVQTPSNG